jgi:hypothetical protein
MLLPHLLQRHTGRTVQCPPETWSADTDQRALLALMDDLLSAARQLDAAPAALTLAVANMVVTPDDEDADTAQAPPPGEYVGVTVAAPGRWSSDWRWSPDSAPSGDLPVSSPSLRAAKACFAYGRDLGSTSSVTVFLLRRAPMSSAGAT